MTNFKQTIELIRPDLLNGLEGVRAWFTTRNPQLQHGHSVTTGLNLGSNTSDPTRIIKENRKRLFDHLEIVPEWIAYAGQIHGTRVQTVRGGGTYPETDGLITEIPGLALAIQVADCAAVLLADPVHKSIGAIHAGWRGAVGGILPNGLETMVGRGADPENIIAFISPCICVKHFEVGMEVAEQFPGRFVDFESYDKPHVDLKGFLAYQLISAGVSGANIETHPGCTVGENDYYYSYRREHDESGRMLGIITLTNS